jgi:membrane protein required for colicin V production
MNWIDVVIIIAAVIGAYLGWKQGLVRTVFSFIGLIIGVVLAGQWSPDLADKISAEADWAYILAFAIILVAVLIITTIIGKILQGIFKLFMLGWLDYLGGIVLGLFVGALVMAAIFTATGPYIEYVDKLPGDYGTTLVNAIGDSKLAELLIDKFGLLLGLLPGEFDAVKGFFN